MTLFLASVRDAAEAEIALAAGADIIDLKEPANGALGAVGSATAKSIVAAVDGRVPTSATIGDLPMRPEAICDAVSKQAALGVDYVKLGLFPDGEAEACLEALQPLARGTRLIVVVFADRMPAFDAIAAAARAGAAGIVLDTADKRAGTLLDHLCLGEIGSLIFRAKAQGLMLGLAGSLGASHVAPLLALEPDLLGFRGALCRGTRTGRLELAAASAIRALIPRTTESAARPPRNPQRQTRRGVMLGVTEIDATWKSA
jgi:dihydroneopterin aldolase